MLGTNVQVNVRLPWIWSGVGNNVGMTEEMARRVVLIRQDTGLEDPLSRKPDSFKHNPLLTWVKENRADLVWSVLTMIQAWVAAGKPISSSSVLPSFESWSRVMGGILEVAGVKGLLTDRSVVGESAKDATSEFKRFVASWWNQFEGKSVRVGTLAFDATPDSYAGIVQADLVNLLLRDMESYDFPFLTRQKTSWGSLLSRLIGQHKGRVFSVGGGGTVKLLRDRDSDSNKWVLVPDEDAARMSTTLQEQMVVEERQKRMQLVMEKATVLNRASAWIAREVKAKTKDAILREECVKREVKRGVEKELAFRDQILKEAAEAQATRDVLPQGLVVVPDEVA